MATLMDFHPSQSTLPFLYEEVCVAWSWVLVPSGYLEAQFALGVELFTSMSKTHAESMCDFPSLVFPLYYPVRYALKVRSTSHVP